MQSQSATVCAGCTLPIVDKFILRALDQNWHESCLKCACCQCRLADVGAKLYVKQNMLLCRTDYLRMFGRSGTCAACHATVAPYEQVMRARENVYHLKCFACHVCSHRFCIGDKFFLSENKILCEADEEEQRVFRQAVFSNQSLQQLTQNIQNLGDFEEVKDSPLNNNEALGV